MRVGLLLFLCSLFLGACAEIPTAQFDAYTHAFNEARPAAEAVLADYSAAKDELARLERDRALAETPGGLPYPATYAPPPDATQTLDDVSVRFLALQAIADYNAALGQLVEGGSVDAARTSVGGFVTTVGQIVAMGGVALPAIGPAVAALQTVAAEVEKARLAAEFADAVRKGAPVVAQIIDVLKADTVDHYGLRFALASRELVRFEAADDGGPLTAKAIADNKARMEKLAGVLDSYNALLDATRAALLQLARETARPADLDAIVGRVIPVVIQLKRDLEAYRKT